MCSDFLGYAPTQEFDIILFRESLYHVPYGQVLKILDKYSKHLKNTGVFIVRLYLGDHRPGKIKFRVKRKIDLITREFDVLESPRYDTPGLPDCTGFSSAAAESSSSIDKMSDLDFTHRQVLIQIVRRDAILVSQNVLSG